MEGLELDKLVERELRRGMRSTVIKTNFKPLEIARAAFPWTWASYQKDILVTLLSSSWNRMVILAPPRHRKTSCVALWAALELGKNPHQRIMVASHTRDYSALLLNQIEEIMKTPIYRRTFGDILPSQCYAGQSDQGASLTSSVARWTTYERHLPNRPVHIKDPSLLALSPESGTPGFGADIIICDDLVSQANSSSETKRRNLEHWFRASLLKRLEPNGRCVVVGARFYKDDLYGVLLKEGWTAKVYRASPDAPLWPEVWPAESLRQKQLEDPIFYPAQYLQDPQEVGSGEFDPSWFQFYTQPPPVTEMSIFGGIDPAITEGTGSSVAYAVVGRTASGQILLLDLAQESLRGSQLLNIVNLIQDAWAPVAIAFESNGPQQTILEMLQADPNLRPGTNLIGVPSLVSKYLRLTSIAAYARSGKILLPATFSHNGELIPAEISSTLLEAWARFPGGKQDILDAFEKATTMALQGPLPAMSTTSIRQNPRRGRSAMGKSFPRVFDHVKPNVLSPAD